MKAPQIFDIPKTASPSPCRGCGAPIYWIETANKRRMPVNADGTSHFISCPKSGEFRRKR